VKWNSNKGETDKLNNYQLGRSYSNQNEWNKGKFNQDNNNNYQKQNYNFNNNNYAGNSMKSLFEFDHCNEKWAKIRKYESL